MKTRFFEHTFLVNPETSKDKMAKRKMKSRNLKQPVIWIIIMLSNLDLTSSKMHTAHSWNVTTIINFTFDASRMINLCANPPICTCQTTYSCSNNHNFLHSQCFWNYAMLSIFSETNLFGLLRICIGTLVFILEKVL
jgi:hypothetical protein